MSAKQINQIANVTSDPTNSYFVIDKNVGTTTNLYSTNKLTYSDLNDNIASPLQESITNLENEIDNINQSITTITQSINTVSPNQVLDLDGDKYFSFAEYNYTKDSSQLTSLTSTFGLYETYQDCYVHLYLVADLTASDTSYTSKIDIEVNDEYNQDKNNFQKFRTIYPSNYDKGDKIFDYWFKCHSGTALRVYAQGAGGTKKINANWGNIALNYFVYAEDPILSWKMAEKQSLQSYKMGSPTFTIPDNGNVKFSGRIYLKSAAADDVYNSTQSSRTIKNYIYDNSTGKSIDFRIIPKILYCQQGNIKKSNTISGSYVGNPFATASNVYTSVSGDYLYVFGDNLPCNVSEIGEIGDTTKNIRVGKGNTTYGQNSPQRRFNNCLNSLRTGGNLIKDNTLYNATMKTNNNGAYVNIQRAISLVRVNSGSSYGDVVETIELKSVNKYLAFDFKAIQANKDEQYVVITNGMPLNVSYVEMYMQQG